MKELSTGTDDVADMHRKSDRTSGGKGGELLKQITSTKDATTGSGGGNDLLANVNRKVNPSLHPANPISTLPPGNPPVEPPVTSERGATLRSIARDHGMKWWDLYKANSNLSANPDAVIETGTTIFIPSEKEKGRKERKKENEEGMGKEKENNLSRRRLPVIDEKDTPEVKSDKEKQISTITEGTSSYDAKKNENIQTNAQLTIGDKNLNALDNRSLFQIAVAEKSLPLHAYEYGRRISKEFQLRIKHYDRALEIFNQKIMSDASKENAKFNWLSLVGFGIKLLLGPGGSLLSGLIFKGMEEAVQASTTIATLIANMDTLDNAKEAYDIAREFTDITIDYSKEQAEKTTEGLKHFNLSSLYEDTKIKLSAMEDKMERAEEPFADLTDRYYQKEWKISDQRAWDFVTGLDTFTDFLTNDTDSNFSIDHFLQQLTFEWIRLNNRPTRKRNKPRTGYLSINITAPEKDPKTWYITNHKVKIHAPNADTLKELLEKHGALDSSKKNRVIDLAEAPVPRRYKFNVPGIAADVKAWSQGPSSVFELQTGFVGKIDGVTWNNYLTAENLTAVLKDKYSEYPIEDVKTAEDTNFLDIF
ncbi:MAG TPA: LysM domain-containing protein [Bacteroidia bacterium]|jgi:hypothetical protein|nr:LysM domain-containing protein [Bacteroidia bacterium]